MTEAEWWACASVAELLERLRAEGAEPSERKQRLAAAAICRRVLHLLPEKKYRRAIVSAEEQADGRLFRATRNEVKLALSDAIRGKGVLNSARVALTMAFRLATRYCLNNVSLYVLGALEARAGSNSPFRRDAESRLHADLFRDIVPLGPPRTLPAVLHAGGATLARLAADAYDCQAEPLGHLEHARLAVLSDALEEAGCTDADILSHLRSPGPHVRGCWALDLILGKS